ncbi:hypothetical protein [Wolbachia endosymbiont (group B) of Parapoynx stratiotata]|nr:hypothetical protein [Wolbachia endosymbiont (group B) of Parapoynx stratiotata]
MKTANESSPSIVISCSLLLVIQVASIPVGFVANINKFTKRKKGKKIPM